MVDTKTDNTILVIDDSTTNVVLLQAVLHNKGYTIETALSVRDAHSIMVKRLPQLILLDLLMPRINGFEFLKELKSNANTQHIPVIIVSALTDQESFTKTMELGAYDYLRKPVDIQILLEKVDKIIKH